MSCNALDCCVDIVQYSCVIRCFLVIIGLAFTTDNVSSSPDLQRGSRVCIPLGLGSGAEDSAMYSFDTIFTPRDGEQKKIKRNALIPQGRRDYFLKK